MKTVPTLPDQAGEPVALRIGISLTHEQVSALYLELLRRKRPAYGWMEEPLVAIEEALKPAHNAIHDRTFNAMNRQFFGDNRMAFDEASMPNGVTPAAPTTGSVPVAFPNEGHCAARAAGESCNCPEVCLRWVAAPPANAPVASVPEGCTPEDAQMLRCANHGLAIDIDQYREALTDLCSQIHAFAEKHGEADFYTGRAEKLLTGVDVKCTPIALLAASMGGDRA